VRIAIALCLLAACELEPAPKGHGSGMPPPAPAAPVAPVAPPAPARPPAPAPAPTPNAANVNNPHNVPIAGAQDPCTDAAVRYTEIGLAEAKDPQMKQVLEIERARTVQRISQGCRDQVWSPEIIACYKAAKTTQDLGVCTKKLTPPAPTGPKAPLPDQPTDKPARPHKTKKAG
jgi:hypothetical protein